MIQDQVGLLCSSHNGPKEEINPEIKMINHFVVTCFEIFDNSSKFIGNIEFIRVKQQKNQITSLCKPFAHLSKIIPKRTIIKERRVAVPPGKTLLLSRQDSRSINNGDFSEENES